MVAKLAQNFPQADFSGQWSEEDWEDWYEGDQLIAG